MNHTPGPWKRYEGYGADFRRPIITDSIPDQDGKCIANCICYVATTNDDMQANADLIAAAPELLEILAELQNSIEAYEANRKPEHQWDEYDYMMYPIWRRALALLDRFGLDRASPT